jgi:hypothetical protein
MPTVRSNPQKWATRTQSAGQDYVNGVSSPRRSWSQAAAAGEQNYIQGVTDAASSGRFGRGVAKAGDAKWRTGVEEKGRTRFQQGAAVGANAYAAGFEPYKRVLEGVTLAPRGPKGQNYGRVQAVGDALRQAKLNG